MTPSARRVLRWFLFVVATFVAAHVVSVRACLAEKPGPDKGLWVLCYALSPLSHPTPYFVAVLVIVGAVVVRVLARDEQVTETDSRR